MFFEKYLSQSRENDEMIPDREQVQAAVDNIKAFLLKNKRNK